LIFAYAVIGLTMTSHMPSSWPGRIELSDRPDLVTFLHFLVKGVGFKVIEQTVFGIRVAMIRLAFPAAYIACFAKWITLAAGTIMLAIKREQNASAFVMAAVAYYTVATVVFVGLFRNEYVVAHFIRDGQYFGADRYFVPPSVFFYLNLVWMAHRLDKIPARKIVLSILAVGFLLAAAITSSIRRFPTTTGEKACSTTTNRCSQPAALLPRPHNSASSFTRRRTRGTSCCRCTSSRRPTGSAWRRSWPGHGCVDDIVAGDSGVTATPPRCCLKQRTQEGFLRQGRGALTCRK
jgi:hypothetical protein